MTIDRHAVVRFAALIVLVLVCYSPVLLTTYGFSEDYRLLSFYQLGATNRTLMIAEGRPLQALWTNLVFGNLNGIDDLTWVRLVSVLFLGLTAVLLARAWRIAGLSPIIAALAGMALMTLPSFQVFAGTAAYGVVPPALVLSVAAALTVQHMNGNPDGRLLFAGGAVGLLLAALLCYQPAGMFYWTTTAILLLGPARPDPGKTAMKFVAVGVAAIALAFCAYLIGRSLFPMDLEGLARADLRVDPALKTFWFVFYPLTHALNLWLLARSRIVAASMALVILIGLMAHTRARDRRLGLPIAAGLIPLSYLPNLMVAENWSSFRSEMALTPLIAIYLILALGVLKSFGKRRLFDGSIAVLAVLGCTSAFLNVRTLISDPQARELDIVREEMARIPDSYRSIGVVMSTEDETLAPVSLYDEFGRPSTSFTWGVANLPWLVLRELHPDADTSAYRVHDVTTTMVQVDTVLDWAAILRSAER